MSGDPRQFFEDTRQDKRYCHTVLTSAGCYREGTSYLHQKNPSLTASHGRRGSTAATATAAATRVTAAAIRLGGGRSWPALIEGPVARRLPPLTSAATNKGAGFLTHEPTLEGVQRRTLSQTRLSSEPGVVRGVEQHARQCCNDAVCRSRLSFENHSPNM